MLLNVSDIVSVADMDAGDDSLAGEKSHIEMRPKTLANGSSSGPVHLLTQQSVDDIEQKIDRALEKARSAGHTRR